MDDYDKLKARKDMLIKQAEDKIFNKDVKAGINKHIVEIKKLIRDEVSMGVFGLVELELLEMKNKLIPKEMEIRRRNRLDLNTPAELAIFNIIQQVEELGADVKLTEAVNLLLKARECVADFVDGVERNHKYYHCQECEFNFVLADNASVNDMKIFDSFKIFHMNPKLNIPCRNELLEVNNEEFLQLFN